jgi:hypothetical protein
MGRLARAIAGVHKRHNDSADCFVPFCVFFYLCLLWPYFFQGGNVLRAGFSFLRPRAQSACISV